MPMVAMFIVPGFALAAAMTSLIVFSGDFGSATITSGKKPTVEIIAKSFSGSYGSAFEQRLADRGAVVDEQERVAVGRGARRLLARDHAAGARLVRS